MTVYKKTKALVLREVKYKEADRILTLYTENYGIMTAKAPGALRKGNRLGAGTQQMTYSEMTLYENKGKYAVKDADIIESFTGLTRDVSRLSLGCYFCECVESLCEENNPDISVLSLVLNSLYALSVEKYSQEHIKATFELRLASLLGYRPELSSCVICGGETSDDVWISVETGGVICNDCVKTFDRNAGKIGRDGLNALRYITVSQPKKIFSYAIDNRSEKNVSEFCESYLAYHSDRHFKTLDYWKKVKT